MAERKEKSTSAFYSERDTLALAQEAVKDGLIEQEVVDRLNSLHPQVPSSMKHRYFLECLRVQMEKSKHSDDKVKKYAAIIKFPSQGIIKNLLYGPEHISDLTELLLPFAYKWRFIGIALMFSPNDLDNYQASLPLLHDSPRSFLVRLLEDWVLKKKHTLPPTQSSLEEALKSQTVGLGILVSKLQQIQKKFSGCFYSVSFEKETSTTLEGFIKIAEGASTLLEANSYNNAHDYYYKWYRNGLLFSNNGPPSFIYLNEVDLDDDGCKFTCRISCGDRSGGKIIGPITLNVGCCLDKFRRNLALMYLSRPEIPKDTWPPVGNKKFINLALIKQTKVNYGSNYARLTIRGDIDDILCDKSEIRYNEFYESLKSSQLILIEGRPGSGKTTFVNKFTQDWATKSGGRSRLVLLVSLRVVNTMPNPGLSDLLKLFKDLKVSQELIEERAGKGVCFIFDGLDEFSPSDGTNSIVYKIINKSYLNQSTVIVASRPAALSKLRFTADKVIEVLGFLNDQIFEYFDSYPFSDSSKPAKLRTYLSTHPNILHMCYLPIHATLVAFLFEVAGHIPKTETEIYTHFTRSTLIRSLTKNEETEARLVDFDTLGEKESKQFKKICQLALDKTISSKQVLDEDEVSSYFHTEKDRDISLGLITIDHTADVYGYKNIYTFLHLTFQEYLAAYHISTLNKEEQIKIFQEYGDKNHMLVVWKFCCGLKIFDESILLCSCSSTLFQIQCAYESQQHAVCEEVLKFMNFQIVFEHEYLSIPDFTALGYLANTAEVPFKLSLKNCNINVTAIDTLLSELNDRTNNSLQQFHLEARTIEVEVIEQFLTNLGSLKSIFVESWWRRIPPSQVPIRLSSLTNLFLINDSLMRLELCYYKLITIVLKGSIQSSSEIETLANGLQSCIILRHLNISDNNIGDDGAKLLASALKSCKKLERFNVHNSSISSSGIIAILDSLRPLNHLVLKSTDVCQYEIDHEDLLYFLEPFTNLRSLHVTLNNVNCGLFWSKSRGWRNLEELYIIAQPEYNMDTILTVCDSFQFLHRLKKLTLRCCIKKVEGARALMTGLKHCPELQILDLNHNIIWPAGLEEIANNLNCLKNLKELHMKNCRISDSGAKRLSLQLQYLPSLQTLCLSTNTIREDGAKAVAASLLQNCPQLKELDFRGNNIDGHTAYLVLELLNCCKNCIALSLPYIHNMDFNQFPNVSVKIKYRPHFCPFVSDHATFKSTSYIFAPSTIMRSRTPSSFYY